jgi:predicted DCC family thiol-disulfide oxidoreductase YuxK
VNTESTESKGVRGWVYYDMACPLCRSGARLLGPLFSRRGFRWEPLQTPGVAARLGVTEFMLLEEMKLQLRDGRVVSGLDSWIVLLRAVWWLSPLGLAFSIPGIHRLGRAGYGWIARNRLCLGGSCTLAGKVRHHRKIPFLDLP